MDVTTVQPISAYYSSDEDQDDDDDVLLYLPIAPEVEEPEDGWNPAVEGLEDGTTSAKRSYDQKENSSPKKKRTKSYDISLTNAPSDGKHKTPVNQKTFFLSSSLYFSSFLEVHPLVSTKSKEKPVAIPGKKVAGPGRPRNSDRSDGKRFERSRSGK